MKTIQYAVIGCGEHACRGHIEPGLKTGFKLIGVYDPKLESVANAAAVDGGNVRKYDSPEMLLMDPDIEAVIIASPDQFHPKQLLSAVQSGKHVLVEKPLAIDSEGMRIVHAALRQALEKKLVITSCHPRRFDPPYVWMKERLGEFVKRFGKATSLTLDFSYHKPASAWKHERSLLLDHLPHEVDYMNFLFGPGAFVATKLRDRYDSYVVAGTRIAGPTFFFSGTRALESCVFKETITVRFERGVVRIDTDNGWLTIHDHETGEVENDKITPTNHILRFSEMMKNFEGAILGTEQNYLTLEDLIVNTESAINLVEHGGY